MLLEQSKSRTARPNEREPHRGVRRRTPQRDGHRAATRTESGLQAYSTRFLAKKTDVKPSTWRIWAFVWIAIAAFFAAFWWTIEVPSASFGFTINANARTAAQRHVVTSVQPNSPAARAGIRVGDSVSLAQPSAVNHLKFNVPRPDDRLQFIVQRTGLAHTEFLSAVAGKIEVPDAWLTIWRLAMLFVAALIAWRRPEDPAARNLVAFLIAFGLGVGLENNALPNALLSFTLLYLGALSAQIYGLGAVARFAANFPTPDRSDTRSRIARVATAVAALAIVGFIAANLSVFLFNARAANLNVAFGVALALLTLAAITNFVLSFRRSAAVDRQRILWLLLTFGVGLSGPFLIFVSIAMSSYNHTVDSILSLTLLVLPVGLGYVILRHRLLDIGFVINRAVVFGLLSAFIVLIFGALEWALGRYFAVLTPTTSATIQLAAALLVGLSLRPVHNRIDRFVDDVLFHERHLAEAALRRFSREALLVSDEQTLLDQAVETVQRWSKTREVQIFVQSSHGDYVAVRPQVQQEPPLRISQDDQAFLAMRTWHERVDLTIRSSRLNGDFAFPFVVRGVVTGAIVCGPKPGRAPYAPDELDALAELARGVGVAYDALEVAALKEEVERVMGTAPTLEHIRERFHGLATGGGVGAFEPMMSELPS